MDTAARSGTYADLSAAAASISSDPNVVKVAKVLTETFTQVGEGLIERYTSEGLGSKLSALDPTAQKVVDEFETCSTMMMSMMRTSEILTAGGCDPVAVDNAVENLNDAANTKGVSKP